MSAFALFIAGCAVQLTGTDLTLDDFELSDDGGLCSTTSDCALTVPSAITCDMTISGTGGTGGSGDPVLDAGCVFAAESGALLVEKTVELLARLDAAAT